MQIKSILAGAAIALVAGVGTASADEEFATLSGISADVMSAGELAAVVGADHGTGQLTVTPPGIGIPMVVTHDLSTEADGGRNQVKGVVQANVVGAPFIAN